MRNVSDFHGSLSGEGGSFHTTKFRHAFAMAQRVLALAMPALQDARLALTICAGPFVQQRASLVLVNKPSLIIHGGGNFSALSAEGWRAAERRNFRQDCVMRTNVNDLATAGPPNVCVCVYALLSPVCACSADLRSGPRAS